MGDLISPRTTTTVNFWARSPYSSVGPLGPDNHEWYREKGYTIEKATRIETHISEVVPDPNPPKKSAKKARS